MKHCLLLTAVLAAILAMTCLGRPLPAAEAVPTTVELTNTRGQVTRGPLRALSDRGIVVGSPSAAAVTISEAVSVRWSHPYMTATAEPSNVFLVNGDVLGLRVEGLDGDSLTARWNRYPAWPALKVPLETVRGVCMVPLVENSNQRRLTRLILDYRSPFDSLVLTNGDTITGELQKIDQAGIHIKAAVGELDIDLSGVRAIGFNAELTSMPALNTPAALISLTDGSHWHATGIQLSSTGKLSGQTQFGARFEVPVDAVRAVQWISKRVTFLSDLQPVKFVSEPYVGAPRPLRTDRSMMGGPLSLRGSIAAKGLGMHSRSQVTYDLASTCTAFLATLGIDDDTKGKGSAIFEVQVDGKTLYKSPLLTGRSPPVAIGPLDLTGGKRLTLIVDYGSNADILDHADWCNAVLIR